MSGALADDVVYSNPASEKLRKAWIEAGATTKQYEDLSLAAGWMQSQLPEGKTLVVFLLDRSDSQASVAVRYEEEDPVQRTTRNGVIAALEGWIARIKQRKTP